MLPNWVRRAGVTTLAALALIPDEGVGAGAPQPLGAAPAVSARMSKPGATHRAVTFAELPGWAEDDHHAALNAFLKSCQRVLAAIRGGTNTRILPSPELLSACYDAGILAAQRKTGGAAARAFFESHFQPSRIVHAAPHGMLTGYFEPLVEASRKKEGPYQVPLYRRPSDLVTLIEETQPGAQPAAMTHGRATDKGVVAFPSRAEIERGALAGRGLELVYVKDAVEVFMLQVQGSGRLRLTDGSMIRVSYDGKNGHPYTSVGKYLIEKGLVSSASMSLDGMAAWLRADPERGRQAMWQNASYVFFKELKGEQAGAAMGVIEIPLVTGRSLAVDPGFHAVGLPIYVSSPSMTHVARQGFHRLMVAHDVGAAIKGPERGDIFFGSGKDAGRLAGITKHPGNMFVLLPVKAAPPTASVPARPAGTTNGTGKP